MFVVFAPVTLPVSVATGACSSSQVLLQELPLPLLLLLLIDIADVFMAVVLAAVVDAAVEMLACSLPALRVVHLVALLQYTLCSNHGWSPSCTAHRRPVHTPWQHEATHWPTMSNRVESTGARDLGSSTSLRSPSP